MKKTRFHVLGLAHQCLGRLVPSCAFTMKVVNMCSMLKAADHEVFLYGASDWCEEVPHDRYFECVSDDTLESLYGAKYRETFNLQFKLEDAAWKEFQRRASRAIGRNLTGSGCTDIVLASYGVAHEPVVPPEAAAMTIEMGIGYSGIFAKRKVWESYAWQHYMLGTRGSNLAMASDTVIPNYLNPLDFQFSTEKGDYALVLGRMNVDKGILEAYRACEEQGTPLVLAGTGDPEWIKQNLPKANYIGPVGTAGRRTLLSQAKVLLALTQYVEPFGGVAIEAAYSGTPVISSDFGAFTETVLPGHTGYRVRDVYQTIASLEKIGQISPKDCHSWGRQFRIENIWPRYESYFEHQLNLYENL